MPFVTPTLNLKKDKFEWDFDRVGESMGFCGLGSRSQKRSQAIHYKWQYQKFQFSFLHFKNISSNHLKHYQGKMALNSSKDAPNCRAIGYGHDI